MFRLQNNTPQVYTEQSRDFQLFCRLYDCINNGVKFDINTMINILDPMETNELMLSLMCTKVGFFPKEEYNSNILRHIISAFPYAIKYKGTKQGIELAVFTILKAEGNLNITEEDDLSVQIDSQNFSIHILTFNPILNENALEDFLSYILPTGYTYTTDTYEKSENKVDIFDVSEHINILLNPTSSNSQIRGSDRYLQIETTSNDIFQFRTEIENTFVGSFLGTEVIGSENNLVENSYTEDISKSNRNVIDEHKDSNIKEI